MSLTSASTERTTGKNLVKPQIYLPSPCKAEEIKSTAIIKIAKHQAIIPQPGAGGCAGGLQVLERKTSASVWKCLLKSTFPRSSPAGHCIARGWFAKPAGNAQAEPGRVGSTRPPSEASMVPTEGLCAGLAWF